MHLKKIIITISSILIAFCITLYFQNEQSVRSMNFDQYKILQYSDNRSHSLVELNEKIVPFKLEDIIQDIFEKNRLAGEKTRVMELGAGNGRVLMELKKLFPEVEFYGINKEKTHTFYRRESFIMTGLKFGLFNKAEIENTDLPYIVFQDLDFGNRIPYGENKFDLIYSQDTIPHVRYTIELFNEIMRVLKPKGLSIHTDVTGINIYDKGVLLDLKDATIELRKRGIDIYVMDNPNSIRFRKKKDNLPFPLTPHIPIPTQTDNLSIEQRRPEMGYNLTYD